MEFVDCPECASLARRMRVLSDINQTDNFYQCDTCGRVSHMPKDASAPPAPFPAAPQPQTQTRPPWPASAPRAADRRPS